MFAGLFATIGESLIFGKVKSAAAKGGALLGRIPQPVWEAIAIVGYALALFAVHQRYADAALKTADQAGYDRRAAEDQKALADLRSKVTASEARQVAIAKDSKDKNDAQNASINAAADGLRAHGPGAASCRPVSDPAVPAAGGEHGPASDRPSDAARASVPAADRQDQLAAVPWQWLVNRARECDLDRTEVLGWRDWYMLESAEWKKLKPDGDKPPSQ